MKSLDSIKIVAFTQDRFANPCPSGHLSWQDYHSVRNALVTTCRKFGPTGPMGIIRIVDGIDSPYEAIVKDRTFWELGDDDPAYFIVDDQMNDERYCYAELYGENPFTADWLESIAATLRKHKGWGLGINNIPGSYLIIFGNRLMVKGRLEKCASATDVVTVASRLLRRGSRPWWQFWN